jgi:formamidopyrimidine-DNA glycosylase
VPELPEVESARRTLQPAMEGFRIERVVTRRRDLRFPLSRRFAARLEGQTVESLSRRAKYLVAALSSGEHLVMHLGMSGSFRVDTGRGSLPGNFYQERDAAAAHDHIVLVMSSGATVTFNDPRRFGSMEIIPPGGLATHRALSALGPEPLGDGFDAAALARACRGRKTAIKTALLDQRVVAGLGNIYAAEALHLAHVSPLRIAATLATATGRPTAAAGRLAAAIKKVLEVAITRADSWHERREVADADLAYFPHRFRVYDREGARCPTDACRGIVRRIVQGGRSTFYCPTCQRRAR